MHFATLVFEGANAAEVAALRAVGAALCASGAGADLLVGDTEEVVPVILGGGEVLTPHKRLRNTPPLELLLLPGLSENPDVFSLLQARHPMDEHVLALGGGVLLLARAGLLGGVTVSAPAPLHETLRQLGASPTSAPFCAGESLTTVGEAAALPQAVGHWLGQVDKPHFETAFLAALSPPPARSGSLNAR